MSLEDGPGDYENAVGPVKEEAEDGLLGCEDYFAIMDADDASDGEDDENGDWAWEGAVDGSQEDSRRAYRPSAARYQLARGFKKRPRRTPRMWNMTYSHEMRVKMGYFAAKWGIKAAKKKFKGVKDSTARDMCKFAQKLVREGKLSLDIPLEKQVIPPKTRNGYAIIPISLTQTKDDENSSGQKANPGSRGDTDAEGANNRKSPDDREDSPDVSQLEGTFPSQSTLTSSASLDFEKKVEIGFLALRQGPLAAMKAHGVSETVVKECRNLVVRLVKSGQLSLEVPLEEQNLPSDPDKPSGSKRSRGRPRKHAAGRPDNYNPPRPLVAVSGSRMATRHQSRPQTSNHVAEPVQDRACEAPVTPSNPHRDAKSDQPQRGRRDISLATDLAFLRWTNRRTSLGFRSDQAFAMHLMDVHDAFCAGQCNGGGRHEQYQNGREVNTEKD